MSALLLILAGLAALAFTGVAVFRSAARSRAADATLATRLETLRPAVQDAEAAGVILGPNAGPRMLRTRFARAGTQVTRRTALVAVAVLASAVVALVLIDKPLIALALVVLAVAVAAGALEVAAARNMAAVVRDLPFLLDAVRQHLTVGSSLQQALIRSIDNAGPGLRRHFLPVSRRIQNGATVAEGLASLAERLRIPEIEMLSVTVQTNIRFGGAISPTLLNVAQILRDRSRVTRELRATTAETRLSGWVLAGLPVVAMLGVSFINPVYTAFLLETPTGHSMLGFAFGLQAVGCVVMARIMRLDF